jgi:hypothetical protein
MTLLLWSFVVVEGKTRRSGENSGTIKEGIKTLQCASSAGQGQEGGKLGHVFMPWSQSGRMQCEENKKNKNHGAMGVFNLAENSII